METRTSFCRFCHAFCGIKVDVENDRVVKITGDAENPMYEGFTCIKGRQLPEQHYHPERLLHSQKLGPDGSHSPVPSEQAMDEVAAKVTEIVRKYGSRAVAMYSGTFGFHYPLGGAVSNSWMNGVGSPMRFSSGSIDQPGKAVASALHGKWGGGPQMFEDADVWMLVGANPVVSMWGGIPQYNPWKRLVQAKKRGLKLVVVDPRKSECAERADLHLQVKPGEDPTLLAGIVRVIYEEGLYDGDFVTANVKGFEELRETVKDFTPDYVEERTGVPAEHVVEAAKIFASGPQGCVTAGTGVNMSPRGNLTEYLVQAINSLCGRWMREGEQVPNPFVLLPQRDFHAQAIPQPPAWGVGEKLRVSNLTSTVVGLPTGAIQDEILEPGEGQIRALICLGGNPVAAWPDQLKTLEALKSLELLVTLDIKMSATAKLAHYVIAPKLSLEVPGITLPNETVWFYGSSTGYPEPYAQYTSAIVPSPAGSDVIEEWEFFWGLGKRMGFQLEVNGTKLDMVNKPSSDETFEFLCAGSRVPLSEVKKHPHGHIFEDPSIKVLPREPGPDPRLDIANGVMTAELRDVRVESLPEGGGYRPGEDFTHRLVSRRMVEVYNSSGRDIPQLTKKFSYNPAFMNPVDCRALGLKSGDLIRITSARASIPGVVEEAPDIASGVISMAHAWGDAPEKDGEVRTIGSHTGRLMFNDRDYDPYTGIPMMSAIPVNISRVEESANA
ncbi:MAG TPA: molybdopterin-dependent oxidoreductase [Dehalococcoidia bacterium]|nr:molybdopterin-dependent oxidoreductase [Dehalococcoidia bacterium]